ncbi:MAG: PIG-L deacetylase family protein [Candidatus Thermoplasmatota archaeon]
MTDSSYGGSPKHPKGKAKEKNDTHVKVLAIGAHPDDIELGLGGCLAKHVQEGDNVYILIFSRGEKGVRNDKIKNKGKMREVETKKALKFLGVKEENIKILGLPDGGIKSDERVTREVDAHIKEINPDVIYTHFFEDDHLDHVNVSLITLHAGRKVKNVLFYESPSTRASFSPNYFVDISEYVQKKVEALKRHRTQKEKSYMKEDVIISKARFRGFQAKVKYAEGFMIYRWVK